MIPYEQLEHLASTSIQPEKFSPINRALLATIRTIGGTKLSYKLRFYHLLMDYVRVIAAGIVAENKIKSCFLTHTGTLKRLGDLLVHFDLAREIEAKIELTHSVSTFEHISAASKSGDLNGISQAWKRRLKHYFQVVELVSLYRNKKSETVFLKQQNRWKKQLDSGVLNYEVRLAETLFELNRLELGKKIPSPFSEAYYSESGRNAFKNFTKPRFIKTLNEVRNGSLSAPKVLDIGCGYGNYIEATLQWNADALIDGLEVQDDLFAEVKRRFDKDDGVTIHHQNVRSYLFEKKYDLILLNYVLFYFSTDEKLELFTQLSESLASGGSILICQYYAGIEALKYELAMFQKDSAVARKIEMHYGNKILYANALWNETASTFSEAEDWREFNGLLGRCSLKINSLTNADRFYYSFFIEVQKG